MRTLLVVLAALTALAHADPWLVLEPPPEIARGQTIVLVSGDEEYRSEEALPQLGAILACRQGFRCVVLFAIDPDSGEINPDNRSSIPGLEHLGDADLMIIATRFRDLPEEDMERIDAYVRSGKPIIGMRTATHAFNITGSERFAYYSWNFEPKSEPWPWRGGFGKGVLGETWVAHHGDHGHQSTRGEIEASEHPIARGLETHAPWGPTDVYAVGELPKDAKVIARGAVLDGMTPDAPKAQTDKNDPMMPIAWTRESEVRSGTTRRVFTTTMGAATDLQSEGTRMMLVNAALWAMGLEDDIPADGCDVRLVGEYHPTDFGFGGFIKGRTPGDYRASCEGSEK